MPRGRFWVRKCASASWISYLAAGRDRLAAIVVPPAEKLLGESTHNGPPSPATTKCVEEGSTIKLLKERTGVW